jgi:hypothetical protein
MLNGSVTFGSSTQAKLPTITFGNYDSAFPENPSMGDQFYITSNGQSSGLTREIHNYLGTELGWKVQFINYMVRSYMAVDRVGVTSDIELHKTTIPADGGWFITYYVNWDADGGGAVDGGSFSLYVDGVKESYSTVKIVSDSAANDAGSVSNVISRVFTKGQEISLRWEEDFSNSNMKFLREGTKILLQKYS